MNTNKEEYQCPFCFNAYVYAKMPKTEEEEYFGTELNDTNDFSSSTIGFHRNDICMYINSGNGEPVNIETCEWINDRWHTVAIYYPKYCPECGRKLDEYEIDERGTKYDRKRT